MCASAQNRFMTAEDPTPSNDSCDTQSHKGECARRVARAACRCTGCTVRLIAFAVTFTWCLAAMWYSEVGPGWLRVIVVLATATAFPVAWFRDRANRRTHRRRTWLAFGVMALLVIVAWQFKQPTLDRQWTRDNSVLPEAVFDGDTVHVRNIRHCQYRDAKDFDVSYYDATFDLTKLRTVHFLVEPFSEFQGPAHTMMAFGFDDEQGGDQYVAISIELRREEGESFHPLPGIFKQYEMMYVVGDERDLIQLRTNHRKHKVYFYPIAAPQADKRKLFVDMLQRANELREEPAFYNTLTSSCTTNIVRHVDRIAPKPLPFSYKVLLPAFADELAYDLELIDTDLPFEQAKKKFRIDEIARDETDTRPFSVRIRER